MEVDQSPRPSPQRQRYWSPSILQLFMEFLDARDRQERIEVPARLAVHPFGLELGRTLEMDRGLIT
jgi:hypothetical protein